MSERYECATCCYATNNYQKFLKHGLEHSLESESPKGEKMKSQTTKPKPKPELGQEEEVEKVERLTLVELRRSTAAKITDAMARFTRLGDRIDVLSAAQKKIREKEVLPLFAELGAQKLEEKEEGGGWYIAERPGKRSFDKERAIRLLASKGVDPLLVKKCFKAAEKPGKPSVEVSRGKGRKKNEEEEE